MRRLAALLLAAALAADEPPEAPAGGSPEAPAESRVDEANREAAERVYRTVAREGKLLATQLKGLRREDVVVVGGLFDFVQELLVTYRCPHTVITPEELEHHPIERPERMVFFLNCHLMDRDFPGSQVKRARPSEEEAARRLREALREAGLDEAGAPGEAIRKRFAEVKHFAGMRYSKRGLDRLGAAVREGAWVFSSDWAVLAVERALPGTVRWTGHTTFEESVEVRPTAAGRRHPLLEGAFGSAGKARWWLETESYLFALGRGTRLLVESRPLAARYHGNRNILALAEVGKGRLVHALSHVYLQQGRADDAAVMQRLLLNFLVEKSVANYRLESPAGDE